MKQIKRDKTFEKHFKQRIRPNDKLVRRFKERLQLFMNGELGYPINDHALHGKLEGKRAFWVAGDLRIIYIETANFIIFLDIGSHSQVYR
jgi:addiction module RelE/StbE family toxin